MRHASGLKICFISCRRQRRKIAWNLSNFFSADAIQMFLLVPQIQMQFHHVPWKLPPKFVEDMLSVSSRIKWSCIQGWRGWYISFINVSSGRWAFLLNWHQADFYPIFNSSNFHQAMKKFPIMKFCGTVHVSSLNVTGFFWQEAVNFKYNPNIWKIVLK